MDSKFVENMTETEIARFERRLCPTSNDDGYFDCSSLSDFLSKDEKLREVVTRDLDDLAKIFHNLMNTAINKRNTTNESEFIIDNKYQIKVEICIGYQYWPFSDIHYNYIPNPFNTLKSSL